MFYTWYLFLKPVIISSIIYVCQKKNIEIEILSSDIKTTSHIYKAIEF